MLPEMCRVLLSIRQSHKVKMDKYEMKAIPILFSCTELSFDMLYFLGRLTGILHILDCSKFENDAKT